jgi:hypothetical protein
MMEFHPRLEYAGTLLRDIIGKVAQVTMTMHKKRGDRPDKAKSGLYAQSTAIIREAVLKD